MFGFKKKPVKFCKDCKYMEANDVIYPDCLHPKAEKEPYISLVSGIRSNDGYVTCISMRAYSNKCGIRARYFRGK